MTSPAIGSVTSAHYRSFMGQWATGVAVVTSSREADVGDEALLSGCTVNAVTSVSLDPPLVLVCLGAASRTLVTVRASRRFALSFLSADQAEIARLFASDAPEAEKFDIVESEHVDGIPVLAGTLAHAVCSAVDIRTAGDHDVILGAVHLAEVCEERAPLLFHRGALGHLPHTAATGRERA